MRKAFICLLLACAPLHADEDTFREKFADPATRDAALTELVPGTREAYFHTALAHQLAGREAQFKQTLAEWTAAARREENPISDDDINLLQNRQLLLDYARDPATSLAGLIQKFDLHFDDARPDAAAAENLPVRIDPATLSEAAFETGTISKSPDQPYTLYTGARLLREFDHAADFNEEKARWFLANLTRADFPQLVPLIARALDFNPPVRFSNSGLNHQLTSDQLATLLKLHPDLAANESFDIAYLEKLLPGTETDFDRDPAARAEHLRRCRDFILTLPPAANSLKAHVLYHHLRLQSEAGNYPKDDFIAFLALPRSQHPLLLPSKATADPFIRLDANFTAATTCPTVSDDLPLIQAYLDHFLGQSDTAAADFTRFIPEKELARLHARARLLAGADPTRWGKIIDPAQFKSLQAEARITFAPGAPQLLAADSAVSLRLDLKNTPDLLVRIYELDLPTHFARTGEEPEVSINLDGMVPHHERHLKFSQASIQLHREAIDLPELTGPGAWLVDFVSGQVSARALIRKGQLIPNIERSATGQIVRVFDENDQPVLAATARIADEIFSADPTGCILIPDAPNQPATTGTVQAGKLAMPLSLSSRAEQPTLEAHFHLDREQLLADQEARLHLRIRLTNHGQELPLDRLQNPALVLKAELLGGITTERVIAENLKLEPLLEIPFQVPADLLKLTLTLRGTVIPTTGGDPVKLSEQETYNINGDLAQARIKSIFFSPTTEGHRLEVRGRNGEPAPSQPLVLSLTRDGYREPVKLTVRTDANGRVDLGKLDSIRNLTAIGDGLVEATYDPSTHHLDLPKLIQLPAGKDIRLPLGIPAAVPDRSQISLLETRDEKPIRDHFQKLAIDNGQLLIRALPPGDFTLTQGSETTLIRISAGTDQQGLLVSKNRILPLVAPPIPSIASTSTAGGQLKIQLRDSGPDTRLTLIGKRYQSNGRFTGLFQPRIPNNQIPGFSGCGYLTDRRLSDEVRYIFDRRATQAYPGSMLPRPGLLLNRWTEEDLEQQKNSGMEGTQGEQEPQAKRQPIERNNASTHEVLNSATTVATVCDFLATPATVRFDLKPSADGSFTLPLADFKDSQFIEITAADHFSTDSLNLPLPASETPLRDRRIARPLDPQAHYLATHSAAVLTTGAEASIENLLDAEWRAFGTLTDAHQFLYGMTGDERLREFAFLTDWPDFTEQKKLELLAAHACHEFHLFLFRKDRAFFDQHVKPLLAQKLEPKFIDDYLLGRDLKSYLRPFAWQQLNAAEKALLAQALPASRATIARELSLRWQTEAPAPDLETTLFTQTLRGSDLATQDSLGLARNDYEADEAAGESYLVQKLRRIIIPRIDFQDVSLQEAINFLRIRSRELDTLETDPSKKGVNIVLRRPLDAPELRVRELNVTNVPLAVALKYIADQTKLRYKIDDYSVVFVPQSETGEDLFTRTFDVPPDFASSLDSSGTDEAGTDPFADAGPKRATLAARPHIADLLRKAGISLPEGASATLSGDGKLVVRATPTELDKIEELNAATHSGPDSGVLPPIDEVDRFAAPAAPQPRFPDHTKLWHESNYYHNITPNDESLIPLNRFWIDLAAWDGNGPFLSPNFNACHKNANEALMCLALLDLPFKADHPEVTVDGSSLRVKAREPMLLFYKDTRRTDKLAAESPLLVREAFSPLAEPFQTVNGHQVENPVTGDFRPGVAYSASLVVTNPTGIARRIDLLAQIPAGAIPLQGKAATYSSTDELPPYGVVMKELVFYFPAAGDFAAYPLHVSEDGIILAHTDPRTLHVAAGTPPRDAASWLALAADGTNDQILNRLKTDNLDTLELDAIRWRLHDKSFFKSVSAILRDRLHFAEEISAYGFLHNDLPAIRDYVENSNITAGLGQWLDSPLLDLRPAIQLNWQTVEFDPLVNARAHRFGEKSRLTHEAARDRYQDTLDQLAWKPALDAGDQLTLAAFLFLQDRIGEGLARFDRIDPATLPGRLPYDYLHTVVLFHREKPADAKAIAAQILPTLPPGLWHDRFQAVIAQADEIAALAQPSATPKSDTEAPAPRLDLSLTADGKLLITHRSLAKASLRLFNVDLEVLFSKQPFLSDSGGHPIDPGILPNARLEIPLADTDAGRTTIDLPPAMRHGNVLVAAESGTTKLLKVLDSSALDLRHTPLDRSIQVLDATTATPLPKTYVKVYVETTGGEVVFHKDGYTDLRGKFDYLSSTDTDPSTIKRLAILVSHPEKGARTIIYDR